MVCDEGGIIVVLGVDCRVDVGLLIAENATECVYGPVVLIMLVSTVLCVAVLKAFELNGSHLISLRNIIAVFLLQVLYS